MGHALFCKNMRVGHTKLAFVKMNFSSPPPPVLYDQSLIKYTLYLMIFTCGQFQLICYKTLPTFASFKSYRGYENPPRPDDSQLQELSRQFAAAVFSALKRTSLLSFYVNCNLYVWRYVTYQKGTPSEHRGHILYLKEDFVRLKCKKERR